MDKIKKVLFDRETIANKVKEIGKQITKDYKNKKLTVVGTLKGSVVFLADLLREIDLPLELDFVQASSYGASTKTSGAVAVKKDLDGSVVDRHVLIVEDIVDTGITMKNLLHVLDEKGAKSVRICSFLDKPSRRRVELVADYVGFYIPDEFVVGYGLDYAEQYRNLPDICVLDQTKL